MAISKLDRDVEQALHSRDSRYTAGRRAVVAALAAAGGPLSAAELLDALEATLPLSSLYRSLNVLEHAGVIEPHFATKGVTRYELAEWLQGHHHHLICVQCGAVDDVAIPPRLEAAVRDLVDSIGSTAEFTPTNHALEIEGRCARCL